MTATSPMPRRWQPDPWLLIVLGLTILICLPFLRMVYGLGDEAILLNGAERMLHGEIIYKDFFEFLPPGGFILTSWWFAFAGISVLSARILGLLVIAGIASLTYLAIRQLTRSGLFSTMLTIAWVATSQGTLIELSHHWLTTLLSMMAFCAALAGLQYSRRGPWLAFCAGATASAAIAVTPTCGAFAWLAAASLFVRQGPVLILTFLSASVVTPALLLAYLLANHDLAWAYADCIRFTAAHYTSVQGVPFGFWTDRQTYPLFDLFPLAGLLTFFVCIFEGRTCLSDRRLHLCIAFAVAGLIGCFPRPEIVHIDYAAPMAMPLFAYCVVTLARQCRPILVSILRILLTIFYVPSAVSSWHVTNIALHAPPISTPRGTVSFSNDTGAPEMLARVAALPTGARYFFYPYLPYVSFLTAREQVSKYDLFAPGYTLPVQYQDACLSVMQRADYVIIDRRWADPAWVKAIFPAMQNIKPPETQSFEDALKRGFNLVAVDKSFELRHRNAAASTALCTGIAGEIDHG
jgi:hypothetical protein